MDLISPSKDFLEISPDCIAPAAIVNLFGQEETCYGSLEIIEVLDELGDSGDFLFPRTSWGVVDPLKRTRIRNLIGQMNYLTDAMDKLYDPNLSIYDIQKA